MMLGSVVREDTDITFESLQVEHSYSSLVLPKIASALGTQATTS